MATTNRPSQDRPRNPLYASVGVGDAAVAKLRELPAELHKLPTELQKVPAELQKLPGAVTGSVKVLREQAALLSNRANDLYADLTVRGEKLVGAVRHQPATEAATSQATSAKRATKGAATSTQKAAKAAAHAVGESTDKID